jgi:NAD(P)-dependent dehydrogenase (short-subunit alcohol dehydrogenase family)
MITGAGQGIGRGIALCLANDGYDIIANDIVADPHNLESGLYEVKARVEERSRRCLALQGDISSAADRARMVEAAVAEFGGIDVLVNNAGVAPKVRADVLEMGEESYDRLMTINAKGPLFLTQAVAKRMIDRVQSGRFPQKPVIIFITSISASVSSTGRMEYCASKAALAMGARVFAHRLAEYDICVFDLRPGIIETPMTSVVKEKYDKLIAEGLLPQARWGTPEDIGNACIALARGHFAYSTGQIIEIGGGFGIPRL